MIYLDLSCIWIGRAWGPGAQAQSVLMLIVMRETYMKRPEAAKLAAIHNA